MGDAESEAHDSSVQSESEDDGGSLIDAHLTKLKELRTQRLLAVIDDVFNSFNSEAFRRLRSEGVDIDESELSAITAAYVFSHTPASEDFVRLDGPVLGELPLTEIPTLLEFIGTAIASGIVGNLAYDALKGALRRLSSRRHSSPVTEQLEEVVLFAVAEMCRRFQLHVDPSRLQVRRWQHGEKSVVAIVNAKGSEMAAEVTIPYDRWRTDGVSVRIQDVSESAAIARAAKSLYHEKYQHDTDQPSQSAAADVNWRSKTGPMRLLEFCREHDLNLYDLMMKSPQGSEQHLNHSGGGLEEVVLFAVAEQCREFLLDVDPDKLRVRGWEITERALVATVTAEGSELTAQVVVPYQGWRRDGVAVRIQDVAPER